MDRPHFRNSLSLSKSFLDDLSQDKLSILDDFQTPKRGTKLDDSFLFHSGEFSIPSGLKGRRTYSIMSETVYSGLTEDSGDTLLEYRDYCEEQSFSQPNEELLKEKNQTVVILGWDDILIPSGFLENALVRRSCSKTISTMSPLDQSASKLLSTALEYGDVIIITNSMPEWVEISGKTFIPNTYEMIMHRNITMLYAKSLYESKFPQDASRWKSEAFLSLEERFDLDIPGNVICISDSENDVKAAEGLGAKFEKCSVKSIRFKKQPSIKELVAQQAFLVEGFSKIYHDEENIQMNIGVNPRSWKGLSRRDMRK